MILLGEKPVVSAVEVGDQFRKLWDFSGYSKINDSLYVDNGSNAMLLVGSTSYSSTTVNPLRFLDLHVDVGKKTTMS